jgi:mannose-6-phosphate isomerase
MAIERARALAVQKPWGVSDLRPWNRADHTGGRLVGEIWYERSGTPASDPSLLLKLLFTSQPLSIQVHPDDAYAQAMGLARGKTEAWYILTAAPGAKIALGLKKRLPALQLREAIEDGSIADLVAWRTVLSGVVVFVPAGAIHAIGAGLVIAEIRQRSDATFRMFDFGRKRELHVTDAVAVAAAVPADVVVKPKRLTDERTLLTSNPLFAFERIELAPDSTLRFEAERETWLLVVSGSGHAGTFDVVTGDAVFAQSESVDMRAGLEGMASLVAYTGVGGPVPDLLRSLAQPRATDEARPEGMQVAAPAARTKPAMAHGQMGAMQ